MLKMRAVDAAVLVLEKEGINTACGVPGAAINPFYSTMKKSGGISHVLAHYVEGASHMAEGYTSAAPGNIGVCIGTSSPAGTDMIIGLYSASADSISILTITGQAPRARLVCTRRLPGRRYRIDRQARDQVDRDRARTGAGAARVPAGVLSDSARAVRVRCWSICRSMCKWPKSNSISTPTSLCRSTSRKATRAQVEKALSILNDAGKPLIVSGGGLLNAAAEDLLVPFAETIGVPLISTLMSWGAIPNDHPLMASMCGLQTSHRYGNATMLASDFVLGIGNRWANRHTGSIEVYTKGRKFVHVDIEPPQIGRVFGPDFGIMSDAKAALELFVEVAKEWKAAGKLKDRSAWKTTWPRRSRRTCRRSRISSSPITPAATNRARARSTTRSCSGCSIRSAIKAGSAQVQAARRHGSGSRLASVGRRREATRNCLTKDTRRCIRYGNHRFHRPRHHGRAHGTQPSEG